MNISNYAIFRRGSACLKKAKGVYSGSHWQNPMSGLVPRFVNHLVYKHQPSAGFLLHGFRISKLWRIGKGRICAPFQMGGSTNPCQFATLSRLVPLGGDLLPLPSGGYSHA